METTLNEIIERGMYVPPTADIVIILHEHSLLTVSGGDDDDTGGTGHNMPWDD